MTAVLNWARRQAPRLPALVMLVAVLVGGGARAKVAVHGAPYLSTFDEGAMVYWSANAIHSGELVPDYFRYGGVPFYLTLAADTAAYFSAMSHGLVERYDQFVEIGYGTTPYKGLVFEQSSLLVWPRVLFACLGALTAWAVFRMGDASGRRWAGVVGGVLLLLSPLHRGFSSLLSPDLIAGYFGALAVAAALRALDTPSRWPVLVAAAMAGLAAGTKYVGGLVILAPLVAVALSTRPARSRDVLAILATAGAAFLATNIGVLTRFSEFLQWAGWEARHYGFVGHPGAEGPTGWPQVWVHARALVADSGMGWAAVGLAAMGVLALAWRAPRVAAVVLVFPVALLATLAQQKVNFPRNLLPLLPMLAFLAGAGWQALVKGGASALGRVPALGPRRGLGLGLAASLILVATGVAVFPVWRTGALAAGQAYGYVNPQTRVLDWLRASAQPADKIAIAAEIPFQRAAIEALQRDTQATVVRFAVGTSAAESLGDQRFKFVVMAPRFDEALAPSLANPFDWPAYLAEPSVVYARFGQRPVQSDIVLDQELVIAAAPGVAEAARFVNHAFTGTPPPRIDQTMPGALFLRPRPR